MMWCNHVVMRTTITIDDRIAGDLKEIAQRTGKSFNVVVNETLMAGLAGHDELPEVKRFRVRPASLGNVQQGVNLHKSLALADSLEDDEWARKMDLRKSST
jgi:hypothetical protein